MGHSYLEFRENHVHLRDHKIRVLMGFLAQEGDHRDPPESLLRLFQWWREARSQFGNGCIDIPFDSHINSESAIDEIQSLLVDVVTTLQAFGDQIPADTLNSIAPYACRFLNPQATSPFVKDAKSLILLLEQGRRPARCRPCDAVGSPPTPPKESPT